ncbi:MAG: CBS domain-containing protein [Putridiphycobacter sp.]|nr:CBS domain-containing protein [Putridiphycobacter sp.]
METTPITSIMTKDVECVTPSEKLLVVKHIYEKRNFHQHIPVVDNEKLVGMVSLVDFMRKIGGADLDDNNPAYHQYTVKDIMSSNPVSTDISVTVADVARVLSKGEFHALPITENEKVVGIVSTADILRFVLKK